MERRQTNRQILPSDARWSLTARFGFLGPDLTGEQIAESRAAALLNRHGVVSRRAVESDRLNWEWRPILDVLSLMELRGQVRRGYFVKGLPGVQFADAEFVELLRTSRRDDAAWDVAVIAASDPAFKLDRPLAASSDDPATTILEGARQASARVVFLDGRPALVAHSNGARIETTELSADEISRAVAALCDALTTGTPNRRIVVSEWNGAPVMESEAVDALAAIGFRRNYPDLVFDALSRPSAKRFTTAESATSARR